jgi:biotin operon repressor
MIGGISMSNLQLEKVYNGSEVIINAGFTMQSNYIVPLLSRMVDEGLINQAGYTLVQTILSYKHTEENPFPSREELARLLGKSVEYVKKGLKSIKEAGILAIVKMGRRNTYDFKPFFTLLEKFIVELKEKNNYNVKISELLNVKVEKKEEKDFSWTEQYKNNKKEVVPAEPVQEEVKEEVGSTLPEELKKVLNVHEIDSEGVKAVEIAYNEYKDKLEIAVFAEKIVASVDKKDFVKYFNKCITNAFVNGEKPKQVSKQNDYAPNGMKIIRREAKPYWFDKYENMYFGETEKQEEPKEEHKTIEQEIAESTVEQLHEKKQEYGGLLESEFLKNNKHLQRMYKLVEAKIENPDLTAEELSQMFLELIND